MTGFLKYEVILQYKLFTLLDISTQSAVRKKYMNILKVRNDLHKLCVELVRFLAPHYQFITTN